MDLGQSRPVGDGAHAVGFSDDAVVDTGMKRKSLLATLNEAIPPIDVQLQAQVAAIVRETISAEDALCEQALCSGAMRGDFRIALVVDSKIGYGFRLKPILQ